MNQNIDANLIRTLQKEIPALTAQIRALYAQLDKKFHLNGAKIPITFGYEPELLGSYTRPGEGEKEHFHFSLLFVGHAVPNPLGREDRMDLYKHEYAHYMQYNMTIPSQYAWQPGVHGSAWKYCCSLIGAVPTSCYRAGEALMEHNYKKVLKNPIHDKTVPIRDQYRREQEYRNSKNRIIQYKIGDNVEHPKFGTGCVQHIEQMTGSVRLHIQFDDSLKIIDQKWLLHAKRK